MTLPPPQLLLHSVFFQKLTSQSMGQGNSLHAIQRTLLVGQAAAPFLEFFSM
jgi:hypothetical protein